MDDYPLVSVIVPVLNEERHIAKCLDSILANDYPNNRMEVLVIDGMSTDNTVNIVKNFISHYPAIRLIENPKRIQAAAMNVGIRESRGAVIIRMDAHTTYAQDYITQCVNTLQKTRAANVGGVRLAVGSGYISNAIGLATTSPFGAGDARYHYSNQEEWVDTLFLGAWHKKTLESIGGFNEEWIVNEDYELNYRLRKSGGRLFLSPSIRSHYFVRDSLVKLAKQYFRYGMWKVKTLVEHPSSLRARQLIPPLFVFALIFSVIIFPYFRQLGILIPSIYLISNLIVSLKISVSKGIRYSILLPVIFLILHLSWGIGFVFGLKRFGIPKIGPKQIMASIRQVE